MLGEHHRRGFLAAGAMAAVVRREPPDDTPFGERLRRLAGELLADGRAAGIVVLGAASIPLATAADRRALVDAAAADAPAALANQRYSADAVAIARADLVLPSVPADLESDNALPRWLAEAAGIEVRDLRARRRLAMDVDSPLDLLLIDGAPGAREHPPAAAVRAGSRAGARTPRRAPRALAARPGRGAPPRGPAVGRRPTLGRA